MYKLTLRTPDGPTLIIKKSNSRKRLVQIMNDYANLLSILQCYDYWELTIEEGIK